MIKTINNDRRGQTALILILLTAAALIFLAITLNWGRIAQTKAILTVAADEGATLLASGPASYGEAQKQTDLKDQNQLKATTSVFAAIVMVVVAIIAVILSPFTGGGSLVMIGLAVASLVMAVANLVLQVVVIQPGITSLWNKLQQGQPTQQQFFEQGLSAAFQGAVTDQVNITDFFDSNANGIFGLNPSGYAKDSIGRFAFFYTDRLKMLNRGPIPQVVFFYDQLGELMNGESCTQNETDAQNYPGLFSVKPSCLSLNSSPVYCISALTDPACQAKIPLPDGFQLNDSCADSNPLVPAYNPYCDPCCQPLTDPNGKPLRPLPPNCTTDISASGAPAQCYSNNPYNFSGIDSSLFTLLYDPSYQEYANQLSFLDQFGRDQQIPPMTSTLTPIGNFPNGIYPFFWLMKDYSPEVDNINLTTGLSPAQYHWCSSGVTPAYTPPTGYTTLTQLGVAPYNLTYACTGADCCVNYLAGGVTGGVPTPSVSILNGPIDLVGSPLFQYAPSLYNPALDPSFGESGTAPAAPWLPGDNQLCSTTWPYNGENPALYPDGTCEWTGSTAAPAQPPPVPVIIGTSTVDGLDDVMHTLSDFAVYSQSVLGNDVGTLSSSFDSWYTQAADWIDPNSDGRLLSIYNPPGDALPPVDVLSGWYNIISSWLNVSYTAPDATSATEWCVPTETALLGGNISTAEDTYINTYSATGPASWGDLPHVIQCLNYNATNASVAYQRCLALMGTCSLPTTCSDGNPCISGLCSDGITVCTVASLTGTACAPSTLGRSLAGPAPVFNGNCDITQPGSYAQWVSNSSILATNEAPKFALRSTFLTDIYTRAKNMQNIFQQGDNALHAFLSPCSGGNCAAGGPAAQLAYAYGQDQSGNSSTASLPNAVIYGWQDSLPPGSPGGCTAVDSSGNTIKVGCSHIVKVTAYSAGRSGGVGSVETLLPWIQTKTSGFLSTTRTFTLTARDGYVYVNVKRWDQDHSAISFPNTHLLWQSLFHNPTSTVLSGGGSGLSSACFGLNGGTIGFGLTAQTVKGLMDPIVNYSSSALDVAALGQAFMLNDEGTGPNAGKIDSNGYGTNPTSYLGCLQWANSMLCSGQESHACVEYVASINATGPSCPAGGCAGPQNDYSLKFVDCNSIGSFPDDLTGGTTGC